MRNTVASKNSIEIRLTDERWNHIAEEHQELSALREQVLDVVTAPERVVAGTKGELLAVKAIEQGKWLIVVYRENDDDGFVITAFLTRRARVFTRRKQVWP